MGSCDWTYNDDGLFESACGKVSFEPNLGAHPDEYMTYCYGCGKPIHFVENKEDDDE